MNVRIAVVGALACCLAACNGNQNVGSKYAKSQQVQALNGGTVSVSQGDDAYLAGTSVQIPPGALDKDTLITVAEGNALALPDGAQSSGPVAELGPASATFAHAVTVTLPYQLPSGQDATGLTVFGVDAAGQTIRVSNADLKLDAANHTVAFITKKLIRYGVLWSQPGGGTFCPLGEEFCGCCGNGSCQPAGAPCPAYACPATCGTGGGGGSTGGGPGGGGGSTGGGGGSGGSCCPAGEAWCGCGNVGQCIPAGQGCPLACPQADPNAGTTTGTAPTCCGPGTYLCGCGGQGKCISDTEACPLSCPICDATTSPSPCGCLPPGAVCQCDPNSPSTVPCQCDPTTTATGSTVCVVDAGSPCAAGESLTACGCLPAGAICVSPDAGTGGGCSTATDKVCCDGTCVGPNQACPSICFVDGGVSTVDGGVCGPTTSHCPNSTVCVAPGVPCP